MKKLIILFLIPMFLIAGIDTLDYEVFYAKDGLCYCIGKDSVALSDTLGDTLYLFNIRVGQFTDGLLSLYGYVDSMIIYQRWGPVASRTDEIVWDSLTETANDDTVFTTTLLDTLYHSIMDLRIISSNTDTLTYFGWYIDLGRE